MTSAWEEPANGGRYCRAHSHGLRDTAAYIVRETSLGPDVLTPFVRDVLTTVDYGAALDAARAIRESGPHAWAVIDTLYADGCRGRG